MGDYGDEAMLRYLLATEGMESLSLKAKCAEGLLFKSSAESLMSERKLGPFYEHGKDMDEEDILEYFGIKKKKEKEDDDALKKATYESFFDKATLDMFREYEENLSHYCSPAAKRDIEMYGDTIRPGIAETTMRMMRPPTYCKNKNKMISRSSHD